MIQIPYGTLPLAPDMDAAVDEFDGAFTYVARTDSAECAILMASMTGRGCKVYALTHKRMSFVYTPFQLEAMLGKLGCESRCFRPAGAPVSSTPEMKLAHAILNSLGFEWTV